MAGAVLILGSVSDMARAAAAAFAQRGYSLYLAGKHQESLDRMAQDVRAHYGVSVHTGVFDAQDYSSHEKLVRDVLEAKGTLSGVVLAIGYVGDATLAERRAEEAVAIITRNFTGAVSVLTHVAAHLEAQKEGFVVATTFLEGDRDQTKNYVYLAARQGLTSYLEGLRQRLAEARVRVITVRPASTDALVGLRPSLFLAATPESVGKRILNALDHGVDTIYVSLVLDDVVRAVRALPNKLRKHFTL